ncbi:hypothetical protein HID58_021941 [Brassica napus]|uniref:Uncharacterized protein n=1 Tax=Brassica napus TaxID=3708 RepID=A0ABQ8CZC1_BRANA|nr:hypothetical protein HID58_021941 [Brassica napus]
MLSFPRVVRGKKDHLKVLYCVEHFNPSDFGSVRQVSSSRSPRMSQAAIASENNAPILDKEAFVTVILEEDHLHLLLMKRDVNTVSVGSGTNIQDNSLVHVAKSYLIGNVPPTIIGDNVIVLCYMDVLLRMRPLSRMGATLLDGVVVEKHDMVAAGALVRQNTRIPSFWREDMGRKPISLKLLKPGEVSRCRVCKATKCDRVREGSKKTKSMTRYLVL